MLYGSHFRRAKKWLAIFSQQENVQVQGIHPEGRHTLGDTVKVKIFELEFQEFFEAVLYFVVCD